MTTARSSQGLKQTSYETEVIERSSGQAVKALILADLTAEQIADTEALWTPARKTSRKKVTTGDLFDPDDLDWGWCKKHLVSAPGAARVFGLIVTDQFEGLMMTSNTPVRGRSSKTSGQELLYKS